MDKDELVEALRGVFRRAYRDWREATLNSIDWHGTIPWRGDDLLELLVTDIERAAALRSHAQKEG
jgi:hypothetical protein